MTRSYDRCIFNFFKKTMNVFFLRFFNMDHLFKIFFEFVTILVLFYALVFWPHGLWDLSSPTRAWTYTHCTGRQSLNHWTSGKSPCEFNFLRNCQIVFQINCTILHSHPVYKNSSSSTNSLTLDMISLKVKILITQSCPTLCDPMDHSPPDSSPRGSSWPRDWTWVSCTTGIFCTIWATREVHGQFKKSKLAILCSDISLWF